MRSAPRRSSSCSASSMACTSLAKLWAGVGAYPRPAWTTELADSLQRVSHAPPHARSKRRAMVLFKLSPFCPRTPPRRRRWEPRRRRSRNKRAFQAADSAGVPAAAAMASASDRRKSAISHRNASGALVTAHAGLRRALNGVPSQIAS
eukprot:1159928-Alexandrium_andersonii.AAC.1